jgi:hypothetical protein
MKERNQQKQELRLEKAFKEMKVNSRRSTVQPGMIGSRLLEIPKSKTEARPITPKGAKSRFFPMGGFAANRLRI